MKNEIKPNDNTGLDSLVKQISTVQEVLQGIAAHAINLSLTARNWLVGYYIVEYEQHGEDRAQYGTNLLNTLSKRLNRTGMEPRRLREYRQFYISYPYLGYEVGNYLQKQAVLPYSFDQNQKWRSASAILQTSNQEVYTETKLEKAILDHLQRFILEMGRGFCFEARQKRILIEQDYFKADLIFYHRILKCHIILDLKTDRFRHEYASQLNMYLNYYRHEVMQPDDNPPIGLLLCTDYGETTVRYATEGLSQNLFVSKYQLQLPSTEEIRHYLLENFDDQTIAKYKE